VDDGLEKDVKAMIETLQCDRGYSPVKIFVNGAYLNEMLSVSTYDPGKGYVVTEDEIREMTEEDEV